MPDITMCVGLDCPIRETCYRFTATPNEHRQSFSNFTHKVTHNDLGTPMCTEWVPNTQPGEERDTPFDMWVKTTALNAVHCTTEEWMRVAWNAATKVERRACAKVCEAEHVGKSVDDETDNVIDRAYNTALRHAAESIRAQK